MAVLEAEEAGVTLAAGDCSGQCTRWEGLQSIALKEEEGGMAESYLCNRINLH